MDFVAELYRLSPAFIAAYPSDVYPELMYKSARVYNCLLVDTHADFYICIPYRSHVSHNNGFFFQHSNRSKRTRSGLDYSKIVLIAKSEYLDSATPAIIDKDEYNETMRNIKRIVREAVAYVDGYANHVLGKKHLPQSTFLRKYQFSTLPYFHDILKLPPLQE